jgi:hypothetical protein
MTGHIDRVLETNKPEFGRLSRAFKGVWNGRLSQALVAIKAAYAEVEHIC